MKSFYTHPAWGTESVPQDIAEYAQQCVLRCVHDPDCWPSDFHLARKIDGWLKERGIAEDLPTLFRACHFPSDTMTAAGLWAAGLLALEINKQFRRIDVE